MTITTPRLHLSPFVMEDAADVFAYGRKPSVSRWTAWRTHRTLADAEWFINHVHAYAPDAHCFAIRLATSPTVIGAIEVGPCNAPVVGLHYVLDEPYWNSAIITEAARAVLAWAMDRYPQLQLIRTSAVAENIGSRRVMEKCGMTLEGISAEKWEKFDEPIDIATYSVTRERFMQASS